LDGAGIFKRWKLKIDGTAHLSVVLGNPGAKAQILGVAMRPEVETLGYLSDGWLGIWLVAGEQATAKTVSSFSAGMTERKAKAKANADTEVSPLRRKSASAPQ
jgi:hypothetical protein